MTALVVFAHGSTVAAANQAIHDMAGRVAARSGYVSEAAFLEIAEPDHRWCVITHRANSLGVCR